ncbi:MAG: ABC transporter substrate-binding protein [Gammaproteobacteria bacterium]|jgi:phospholipid transport system substrate-binding protein
MAFKNYSFQSIQILLKVFLIICFFLSANLVSANTEQENAMRAPVDELHNALISIMQSAEESAKKSDKTSSFEERYALLEKVIVENFNTPLISRVVLSRYWKSLDEKTRTDFINLFNRLTIATYVDRFDSYENETFKHIAVEPMKKGRYLVKTELVQTDGDSVSFNYIVQSDNEKWKIISVIANGVNDLSLKRGEYSSVIKAQGFDALIENIQKKIMDIHPNSSQ